MAIVDYIFLSAAISFQNLLDYMTLRVDKCVVYQKLNIAGPFGFKEYDLLKSKNVLQH